MVLTAFLLLYRVLWTILLPFILIYLWHRGRRDPLYFQHLPERFGFYTQRLPEGAIWLHAVSLGETRSAAALIRLLLDRGDKVVITNFTPTGRREAQRQFKAEIASGRLAVVWVPFDMRWTYRRFFKACQPRIGLTLEVEVWPGMIFAAKTAGVPLYMCNGQYASPPLERDSKGLRIRQRVMRGLTGAFVKSKLQASRFKLIGLDNVVVTGELRFDQPIPPAHLAAAEDMRTNFLADTKDVITIASGVEGEEGLYIEVIQNVRAAALVKGQKPPLFIYVPRAPERFDAVAEGLEDSGLITARRSKTHDDELAVKSPNWPDNVDVFLGDSLGEMYLYLNLADRVVVGAGFTPKGAHNIIEPLALGKPVLTGPYVWTIEYPFVEAETAGVAEIAKDGNHLATLLTEPAPDFKERIDAFLREHSGASQQTLKAIDAALEADPIN